MKTQGVVLFQQTLFHVFVFCLFCMLFSWPLLAIASPEGLWSMFTYLYVCWFVLFLVMFGIQRSMRKQSTTVEVIDAKDRSSNV